jgi:hypothetical protein
VRAARSAGKALPQSSAAVADAGAARYAAAQHQPPAAGGRQPEQAAPAEAASDRVRGQHEAAPRSPRCAPPTATVADALLTRKPPRVGVLSCCAASRCLCSRASSRKRPLLRCQGRRTCFYAPPQRRRWSASRSRSRCGGVRPRPAAAWRLNRPQRVIRARGAAPPPAVNLRITPAASAPARARRRTATTWPHALQRFRRQIACRRAARLPPKRKVTRARVCHSSAHPERVHAFASSIMPC